ncbi:MAG: guanylate kinase [Deltaproteobacteria bacterium]|nr:guanylate kinase [Deltaproteobacteria bacterium]MBW2200831.1 guanylate kinase [Deltaproteobacteria bacterium]
MKVSKIHALTENEKPAAQHRGHLFIVSAPSGGGKTTLCKAILNRYQDMLYSVSYTTRAPRPGEVNGVDYDFISKEKFIKDIENDKWAEWAQVHGNFYGTPAEFLNKSLSEGRDVLLDIDIQGTIQILDRYTDTITFFILPPSLEILKKRLESRGTDSADTISARLISAKEEISKKNLYRHVIVNDQLSSAVSELLSIIAKYRSGNNPI